MTERGDRANSHAVPFRRLHDRLGPLPDRPSDTSELAELAALVERVLDEVDELRSENSALRAQLIELAPRRVPASSNTPVIADRAPQSRQPWRVRDRAVAQPARGARPIPVTEVIGTTARWTRPQP